MAVDACRGGGDSALPRLSAEDDRALAGLAGCRVGGLPGGGGASLAFRFSVPPLGEYVIGLAGVAHGGKQAVSRTRLKGSGSVAALAFLRRPGRADLMRDDDRPAVSLVSGDYPASRHDSRLLEVSEVDRHRAVGIQRGQRRGVEHADLAEPAGTGR